jgi:hypothetical protein
MGCFYNIILPSLWAEHLVFTFPGGRLIPITGSSADYYLESFGMHILAKEHARECHNANVHLRL